MLGLIIASLILSSCTVPEWIPTNLLTGSDEMRNGSDFIKRVNVGYKFGYINKDGKVVIPAKYDEVFPFKNGRARVRVGERIGYIDRDGNYIQKPECSSYDRQFENYYWCSVPGQNKPYIRNWKGQNIIEQAIYPDKWGINGFSIPLGGESGHVFISIEGKEVFRAEEFGYPHDGIVPFRKNLKWGYIREDGTVIVPAIYDRADPFQDGSGYVGQGCEYHRVSPEGNLSPAVHRPRKEIYDCGPPFYSGGCKLRVENEQAVVCRASPEGPGTNVNCEHQGKTFTVKNADAVSSFQYGMAPARESGTEIWGIVDLQGQWVIEPRFNTVGYYDGCHRYVEIDYKPFAMDRSGQLSPLEENVRGNAESFEVGEGVRCAKTFGRERAYRCMMPDYKPHPQRYEEIDEYRSGLMAVTLDYGKAGFVDRDGHLVIPARFVRSQGFSNNLAPVRIIMGAGQYGRAGYINLQGQMAIPALYSRAEPFRENLARVADAESYLWFYIRSNGQVAFEGAFAEAQDFSEGLAGVAIGTQWGFLDKEGNLMFGRKYDYGYYISEGKVSFCDRGLCGYLNEKGEVIIPARFCETEEFSEGLAAVAERCIEDEDGYVVGIWGYIDSSGEYVLPPSEDYTGKPILDGYTIVKKKGLYGIMDRNGQISTGYRFRTIHAMFGEDTGGPVIYRIELDGKFGFIRGDGSLLTGKTYKQVLGFDEGRAFVLNEDFTWSMINANGEVMAKTEYTVIGGYQSLFECGLILVGYVKPSKREELVNKLTQAGIKEQFGILRRSSVIYGYMDRDGELVIPLDFAYANPFQSYSDAGCYASVRKLSGARYIKIDVDGNEFPDF